MFTHMAQELSSFFISRNMIKEEERIVYNYCFEVFLSTIINLFVLVIFALVSRTLFPTICFIVGFIVIRSAAGGYHAETHIRCFLILMGSYILYLFLILMIPNYILSIITVGFCIVSLVIVAIFAPVDDYNKPFSKEEYKKFKVLSNIVVILVTSLSIMFVFLFQRAELGFSVAAGMCVVSLSLIAGTVKNGLRVSE